MPVLKPCLKPGRVANDSAACFAACNNRCKKLKNRGESAGSGSTYRRTQVFKFAFQSSPDSTR